jgi:hypothetical protein
MSEKIEAFWENATAKDVERVMAGETVEARFRDFDKYDWWSHDLSGWCECSQSKWIDSNGSSWVFCQVYREPSWWTDKPDPGPGFRLLEKFPDEELKLGDEAFDLFCDGKWAASGNATEGDPQAKETWYRRRIEPVEPVEHYLGKVEAIKQFIVGDTFWHPNGLLLKITEKGFEVTQ